MQSDGGIYPPVIHPAKAGRSQVRRREENIKMQQVELRTSTRRHVCGKGVIIGETKRYIKVQVVQIISTITRVKPGDVINFSKLDGRSKNGFTLGL